MSSFHPVQIGAVVFVGWQTMVVLEVQNGQAVLCPLVYDDDIFHRADIALKWFDLVDAGLSRVDVRCRAISCQRDVRKLRVLGQVSADVVARIVPLAVREQTRRSAEQRMASARVIERQKRSAAHERLVRQGAGVWQMQAMGRRVG